MLQIVTLADNEMQNLIKELYKFTDRQLHHLHQSTKVRFASFHYDSNKSTGKKTGKTHLCSEGCLDQTQHIDGPDRRL